MRVKIEEVQSEVLSQLAGGGHTDEGLTSIFGDPHVVVRIWRVSPGEDHKLRRGTIVIGNIKDVKRVSVTGVPRRKRARVDRVVVLEVEVASEAAALNPVGTIHGAPNISALFLVSKVVCLIQLACSADDP